MGRRVGSIASSLALAACGRIDFERSSVDAPGDAAPPGFTSLIAYGDDTCALFAGDAYCWGSNQNGQIGDVTNLDAATPTRVQLPAPAIAITQGDSHGCAIVEGGDVYCWGVGTGNTPMRVAMPPATVIGGGNNFTCAIADVVRCWGVNDVGQCGTGTVAPQPTAMPVAFASGYAATQLDVGDDHACAFAPGNAPQCWGHNDDGALGLGSLMPTQVLSPTPVAAVITSLPHIAGWHACALAAGRVQCWGEGTSGELGDGMSTTNPMPVQVSGLGSVTALATGGGPVDHDASCAIGDGAVTCWGRGEFGRLGNGMAVSQPMPVAVLGLPARATSVAIGYGHACTLLVDGDVWCWGRGDRGQLGDGMKASSLAPVRVVRPSE